MKWTESEIEFLKENYPSIGPKKISISLNRTVDSVNLKLKSLNLRGKINKRNKSIDFELTDINHLYIMGILWADGYVHETKNRIELSINSDDFNEISWLFNTEYWSIYTRERDNRKSQTTVGIYNIDISNRFRVTYNYTDKSKLSPNFIKKIDKEILCYFIRGFFDGDGCFYVSADNKQKQCYLAGSYDQNWDWIEELFNDIGVEYSIKRKVQNEKSKYSIVYIKKKSISTFGNYIYKDFLNDNIGLKRKYNKFLNCI